MFLRVAFALSLVVLAGFVVVNTLSLQTARAISQATVPADSTSAARQSSNIPAAETNFIRQLSIPANDVVFDKVSGRLYASVPGRAGANGNSIARIDPVTGTVESFVFVGSEPGKLALADDGKTLYVSLDAAAAIRRYDLTTQTAQDQFALGDSTSFGPLYARDLAVAPGNPNLLAVSRRNRRASPDFEGVAVYDNGVQAPLATATFAGSDFIGFSASASVLYGVSSSGATQKLSVTGSGVTVVSSGTVQGGGGYFKVQDGLIYLPSGRVYNPETNTTLGTFTVPQLGPAQVEPDSSVGRVFFVSGQFAVDDSTVRTMTLHAFDRNTFVPLGTLDIPNVRGAVNGLVRWGANGLAFASFGGLYLIQTTLVPSNEPVPTPTATPSPTPSPTPTPTPAPGDLREVLITAKDLVINPSTQIAYVSVPSSVGSGGNSITPFDPASGAVGQPVFVGSEPNKLAISNDGQVIYVGLDGAHAVRKFDVANGTAGTQFPVGSNQQGQFVALDMAVPPGQPNTLAVLRGINNNPDAGLALYDDGVPRANITPINHRINVIRFSASPLVLYGFNNTTSEYGFRKMAATSCGVSILDVKLGRFGGFVTFQVSDGRAYSTSGTVIDPETGELLGANPLFTIDTQGFLATAISLDPLARRAYYFSADNTAANLGAGKMLLRVYDTRTFLLLGTLMVPNIVGAPTAVVRWGPDGFAFRTTANKVYLLRTSLIQPPSPSPGLPAPLPTPPTYSLRGQVTTPTGTTLPPVTMRVSGVGQSASVTTNANGSFAFTGLPFCTSYTVTPDPIANFTFSPASVTVPPENQINANQTAATFNALPRQIGFNPGSSVSIAEGGTAVLTVRRFNDVSTAATVDYQTVNNTASDRSDYLLAVGTLRFAPNEASKQVTIFTTNDALHEANETLTLTLSNPTGSFLGTQPTLVLTIVDNDSTDGLTNPADDAQFFVRQHYQDFLNRNPDTAGLDFWTNEITSCGTDPQCIEVKRINVSAAFFLSIEFQQTGYLVYKANQASFNSGEQLALKSFLSDTQEIGRGVIVGQPGADAQLEANKQRFFLDFVQRPAFISPGAYPLTLTAAQFVDKLNGNTFDPLNPSAGPALTPSERDGLVAQLSSDPASATLRAQVLRSLSENGVFHQRQFSKAFVLMQYFGYMRREPNTNPDSDFSGYNFWLGKLNEAKGNFIQAEMVKAFISSSEYRGRFGH